MDDELKVSIGYDRSDVEISSIACYIAASLSPTPRSAHHVTA